MEPTSRWTCGLQETTLGTRPLPPRVPYLHTEDDARHEATQEGHRIGWTREG